jgi:hypothetical protein
MFILLPSLKNPTNNDETYALSPEAGTSARQEINLDINHKMPYTLNLTFWEPRMKNIFFVSIILYVLTTAVTALHADVHIPVGAKIKVFWRFVPDDVNPIDIREIFQNLGFITAVKSNSGDGGITGKQIITLIKKNTTRKTIIRYRALSLKNGEDPSAKPSLASIAVRNNRSMYDKYIIINKNNEMAIYVDVLVVR